MNMDTFEYQKIKLHSEEIDVIHRILNGKDFILAANNGRLKVWGENFFAIEPEFIAFAGQIASQDVFWDIGCSIAHFSIYTALSRGCRVYGFEPEPQNFGTASLNRYLNFSALDNHFNVLNFGIGRDSRLATMYMALYGSGEHTKTLQKPQDGAYGQPVLVLSLDKVLSLDIPKPTVLKIDVDGSEKEVLGALSPVMDGVRTAFIEVPKADFDFFSGIFKTHGLEWTSTHEVRRMSGGFYPDIINVIFTRP